VRKPDQRPVHAHRIRRHADGRAAGFTLIELMVVVVIAAIFLAMAMPSFTEAIERNRIASQTNEFIAAVSYARGEAIRRTVPVGLCSSNDQQTCSGSWQDGWIVYSDENRDGTAAAAEVLRAGGSSARDEFAGDESNIQFGARGNTLSGAGAAWTLQPADCPTDRENRREFSLTLTGNLTVAKNDCEA